jgi:hypothetical protein
LCGRRHEGHGCSGALSLHIATAQIQLAIEDISGCNARDEEAIQRLVNELTDGSDMERLVMAIPGSFNTERGKEMRKRVLEALKENGSTNEDQLTMEPHRNIIPMPPPIDTSQHDLVFASFQFLTVQRNEGIQKLSGLVAFRRHAITVATLQTSNNGVNGRMDVLKLLPISCLAEMPQYAWRHRGCRRD